MSYVTEEEWQAAIDADITNHAIRLAFADWLEERGDPRAAGYKWMGENGKYPYMWHAGIRWDWFVNDGYQGPCSCVSHLIYRRLTTTKNIKAMYGTRRAAEEDLCRVISEESLAPSLTNPIS